MRPELIRPELVALVRLVAICATGMIASRLLCRGRALLSIAESALFALALAFVFRVAPWLCVVWTSLAVWCGRQGTERSPQLAWPLLGLVLALYLATPHEPMLWDEQIWLLKAKLATTENLRVAALTDGSDAIPVGYPIGYPLVCAWLGGPAVDLGALFFRALCLAAFAAALLRERPQALLRVALVLAATPLVLVHARSAYVDLPVGLLSASLYLELTGEHPVPLRALVYATMLAGLKDEGFAHAVVVGVVATIERPRSARRPVALSLVGAGIVFVTWRALLALHGVVAGEHALGRLDWRRVGTVLWHLGAHLTDLRSFGLLYAATVGALICAVRVRALRRDAAVVLALLGALLVGVLCGPYWVRDFAVAGTLLGRLLVQLAPLSALLVTNALLWFTRPGEQTIPIVAEGAT